MTIRYESICIMHLMLSFYYSSQRDSISKKNARSTMNSKNLSVSFTKTHYWCWYRFVKMKSRKREFFIKALQKLRSNLKKTVSELDDHLEILKDDIADLLERLQHSSISQKLKIEQCNEYQLIIKDQKANCSVTRSQSFTMSAKC